MPLIPDAKAAIITTQSCPTIGCLPSSGQYCIGYPRSKPLRNGPLNPRQVFCNEGSDPLRSMEILIHSRVPPLESEGLCLDTIGKEK